MSSRLCVWFFVCGIGQTGLSTSDLLSAAIYCAIVYFVFGIMVSRPIAVLCGTRTYGGPPSSFFPRLPTWSRELPGRFVSGSGARSFLAGVLHAVTVGRPPKNDYVRTDRLTGENR
ncbi:MAG: hypothetical protein DMG56_17885 [Acidobacteria bacterium]|nr:MAG: hypothetical protein DMG55_24755 [Acidobacteriota bacterium]PYU59550.1 MAG: hypothetical protein DMG56_17885 [Acidobacteriota bacterium]